MYTTLCFDFVLNLSHMFNCTFYYFSFTYIWLFNYTQVESTCVEIDSLNNARSALQKTKSELESKRDSLLQALNQVNQEIDVVDNDLAQIQPTIVRLEREKQEQARHAYQLHKSMQLIPSSASDDNKAIQEADEIRMRAMNVIQNALGSL